MNLIYIRAAIQAATGVDLTQERVLELLVEEGLLTKSQANQDGLIFRGYDEFFHTDIAECRIEPVVEVLRIEGPIHNEKTKHPEDS